MNTKKILMVALSVLFASLLVVGCSSDDDPPAVAGDSGSKPDDSGGSKPPVGNGSGESNTDSASIQGKWETQCLETKEGGGRIGFEFKGKAVTMVVGEYSDNSCSQTPKTTKGKGKFVFGKAVTTSSGLSANELDINLDNEDPFLGLVAVNGKKMSLALDVEGKRPSDLDPSIELDKVGGSGGSDGSSGSSGSSGSGGSGSGRDCDPCKSQSDCGGGTECSTFGGSDGSESNLCALPETQECPI